MGITLSNVKSRCRSFLTLSTRPPIAPYSLCLWKIDFPPLEKRSVINVRKRGKTSENHTKQFLLPWNKYSRVHKSPKEIVKNWKLNISLQFLLPPNPCIVRLFIASRSALRERAECGLRRKRRSWSRGWIPMGGEIGRWSGRKCIWMSVRMWNWRINGEISVRS